MQFAVYLDYVNNKEAIYYAKSLSPQKMLLFGSLLCIYLILFVILLLIYGRIPPPSGLYDGRGISRSVAHLNILVHDVINLLYYEY